MAEIEVALGTAEKQPEPEASGVERLVMHEALKERVGIEVANCSTCTYLGSDDDGNYPEFAVSWPVCEKFERYQHLKSFPFKEEQKCWVPEFWASKFTDLIKRGEHEEVLSAIGKFVEARDSDNAQAHRRAFGASCAAQCYVITGD